MGCSFVSAPKSMAPVLKYGFNLHKANHPSFSETEKVELAKEAIKLLHDPIWIQKNEEELNQQAKAMSSGRRPAKQMSEITLLHVS
jgi:hypothetical protein